MPPIDGRIDRLFDCLDNLCEFRHNASHSGFKDEHARIHRTAPKCAHVAVAQHLQMYALRAQAEDKQLEDGPPWPPDDSAWAGARGSWLSLNPTRACFLRPPSQRWRVKAQQLTLQMKPERGRVHRDGAKNPSERLKMQWTPEHSQWAEQHFDISSTTRSPAHKAEAYRAVPGHLQRSATYQYAWANDDISALTASNLLKKYAEKYSGILEMPGAYSEAPGVPGVMNGRKGESEPWQDGVYPMSCIPEGVSVRKGGVAAASEVVSGMCSSPGLASSTLSEPSYSSSSCGSHTATALHSSSMPSQEYGPAYSSSYLHSSYSSQSTPAPALPSPLHSSGLLQPPPPPPSHPT
ncbi:Fidgetin, partial [Nibea albiflora]